MNRRTSQAGPLCAALHIGSEHMPHAASSREGLFHSLAPGHCQSPFSWWSITLVGNSSMSVSSNNFEKHFSELSPLQKAHYADIHHTPSKSSCYTQRRGHTHHRPNKKQVSKAFIENKRAMAVKYSQEPKYNSQAKSQFSFWQPRDSWPSSQLTHSKQKLLVSEDLHHWPCESHPILFYLYYSIHF